MDLDMTQNFEIRELTIDEVEVVSGGNTLVEIVKSALGWMFGKMTENPPAETRGLRSG
jgi:hypothetical protein